MECILLTILGVMFVPRCQYYWSLKGIPSD